MSSLLWNAFQLGSLRLPGRLVRTAAGESLATDEGLATPALRDHYDLLGRDGALGLIITGHCYVHPAGQKRARQINLCHDKVIPGLARVSKAAGADGSRIFLQISHAGLTAEAALTGHPALGPSPLPNIPGYPGPEELGLEPGQAMTEDDIATAISAFAQAALRAREAGFHGVELHAGHGFLLNQFLSPLFNRRSDAWGGDAAGRAGFACQVIRAIKILAGKDFPVIAKVNACDLLPGGLELEESIVQVRLMQAAGLDGVEISGGNCVFSPLAQGPMRPLKGGDEAGGLFFAHYAQAFHQALEVPVIVVGGVRSMQSAQTLLENGSADLIGLCRPLIREPGLARRWQAGDHSPGDCRSCSRCLAVSRDLTGLRCPLRF